MIVDLSIPATQKHLADLVGVTQPAISALVTEGKLVVSGSIGEVLMAYCHRLREQAAGRLGGEMGGLDLVQERAALARSQRIAQDLRNAVARGEYAPIDCLGDILATASGAVVDRMDQLEASLSKACPTLPDDARDVINAVIAAARNEWVRSTQSLVEQRIDTMLDEALASDDGAAAADTTGE